MVRVLGIVIAAIVIAADLVDQGMRITIRALSWFRSRLPRMSTIDDGGEGWMERLHFHLKGQVPTKAR